MKQLQLRVQNEASSGETVTDKTKKGRKDMHGITALVDSRATMALINHKASEKYDDDITGTAQSARDEQGDIVEDKLLCKLC